MAKVGVWDGVDAGSSRVANADRITQNNNYASAAQRYNLLNAFGRTSGSSSSGPAPGLG